MRRFLLVLFLAAAALAVPQLPHAAACSCAAWPADVPERLPEADGAFVGTLLARDDPEPVNGILSGGTVVRYQYRVDRVVKGDISSGAIDVWAAWDGAACGLGKPLDHPAGLLLERDGSRWTSNLCSIADPDTLLQAAQAPPPSGTVVPAVLAGSAEHRAPDRRPLVAAAAGLLVAVTATRAVGRRRRTPKPTVL